MSISFLVKERVLLVFLKNFINAAAVISALCSPSGVAISLPFSSVGTADALFVGTVRAEKTSHSRLRAASCPVLPHSLFDDISYVRRSEVLAVS
jgi:hypothetical protein